jgi:hypothetical protein
MPDEAAIERAREDLRAAEKAGWRAYNEIVRPAFDRLREVAGTGRAPAPVSEPRQATDWLRDYGA